MNHVQWCPVAMLVVCYGLVAGCTLLPAYQPPATPTSGQWQAALPHGGTSGNLLGWWSQFNDPVLTALLKNAEAGHPSLEKAAAAIREARAGVTTSQAAGLPVVDGKASATRASSNSLRNTPATTTRIVAADASWEMDVFGTVRHATESASARVEARVGDWHAARLSLAAEVASHYVNYRACQRQVAAYQREFGSQRETARAINILVQAGFSAPADGNLAQANVANASANVIAQRESCDLTVKSLVTLTGMDETGLRQSLAADDAPIPTPTSFDVAAIPASRVSQRPDAMVAERTLAAAYADIGSAEADRYPRLSLLGSITATALSGGSATTWAFGPSLALPLFDAGKRKATANAASARYDQAQADYKQTVRDAVKEVEQALVRLDSANRRESDARNAAANYRAHVQASEILWKSGGLSLLDMETARRSSITAELNVITLQRDQVIHWIALYKALGGDWDATPLPATTTNATR